MVRKMAKNEHVLFPHDSQRLVLPRAVISCLVALIEGLPDLPSTQRVELRNALAAIRRAYKLPAVCSEADVHLELEESEDAT